MRMIVLAAASLLVFAVPAVADDEGGAMGQLENATSGHQDLDQTYGDSDHSPGCPDACPDGGDTNVPEPPPPTPVDDGQN